MYSRRTGSLLKLGFFVVLLLIFCVVLYERPDEIKVFQFSKMGTTVTSARYVSGPTEVVMTAPDGTTIYYTTDGSIPDEFSLEYSGPIALTPSSNNLPDCLLLKAVAYYADGTKSEVVTHSLFSHSDIRNRFGVLVLSISGNPDDLTEGPDGILFGENVFLRGPESEREIYIEAISAGGKTVFEQDAGVRVYGGASRNKVIKSLKLYARRTYDENHGMFAIDVFGTVGDDHSVIDKYDRLVARNFGNDFGWAFVREELNQRLAAQAGYQYTKAVVPAIIYLNGEYYGLFWLQEVLCDEYLKDRFGGAPNGRFAILEGSERLKNSDPTDPFNVMAAQEYNDSYIRFTNTDMTVDSAYDELCRFMDVESYLQLFAYNVYINNWDWPYNNYKCFRYYPDDGETYGEGELDGRWRFYFHDMDYSMGLLDRPDTVASYNNLQDLLNPGNSKYSPLFANLLEREDCRNLFLHEIIRLMNGPLSHQNVAAVLDGMNLERDIELQCFFEYLDITQPREDGRNWALVGAWRMEHLKKFAKERPAAMKKNLIEIFDLPQDYFGE